MLLNSILKGILIGNDERDEKIDWKEGNIKQKKCKGLTYCK